MRNHHNQIHPNNSHLDLRDYIKVKHQARSGCDSHIGDVADTTVDICNNVYYEGDSFGAQHLLIDSSYE